jgi:Thioredoxin domain
MHELPNITMKQQHHTIEIFSAGCPLCRHIFDDIQVGKCQGCNQTVYDVNRMTDEVKSKMKDYGITSVPTTIIDGSIKVVGIPNFPWICGEDLYLMLKSEYPLGKKTNH